MAVLCHLRRRVNILRLLLHFFEVDELREHKIGQVELFGVFSLARLEQACLDLLVYSAFVLRQF